MVSKHNAPAHHERPERVLSELADIQRGRDAVARTVKPVSVLRAVSFFRQPPSLKEPLLFDTPALEIGLPHEKLGITVSTVRFKSLAEPS